MFLFRMFLFRILWLALLVLTPALSLGIPSKDVATQNHSIAPKRSLLQKRALYTIQNAPSDEAREELEGLIQSCRETARRIVSDIQRNNAVFLSFFGTDEHYVDIMTVFRRIADLGVESPDFEALPHQLRFSFEGVHTEQPGRLGDFHLTGQAGLNGEEADPLIRLYQPHQALPNSMRMLGPGVPNVLEFIAGFRWLTVMHEVSRLRLARHACGNRPLANVPFCHSSFTMLANLICG